MKSNPLVSILIATKNRQSYAFHTISHILEATNDNFELIISDNSDTDELSVLIESFKLDDRLKYQYINGHISSIHNFRNAIKMSTGKYVCLIGDDDGISHEFFNCVDFANDNNIDCLVGSLTANYRWASTGQSDTFFTKMTDSTLTIDEFSCRISRVNINSSLKELYYNGYTNYLHLQFPKLYHGIVKRSFFTEIKSVTGEYLGGLSPDIYSAVSLALMNANTFFIDFPITIPGVCKVSSSVQEGVTKKHSLELSTLPHLNGRGIYEWDDRIPSVYSVHSIWADSALAAFKDLNKAVKFDTSSLSSLCVSLVTTNPKVFKYVITHLNKKRFTAKPTFYFEFITFFVISFFSVYLKYNIKNRVIGRLKILKGTRTLIDITGLTTIGEANLALKQYCIENGKTINYDYNS